MRSGKSRAGRNEVATKNTNSQAVVRKLRESRDKLSERGETRGTADHAACCWPSNRPVTRLAPVLTLTRRK
jgi:hypothetical protein